MENKTIKKRILITAFDFPPQTGGVATYSWELAQSLSQQGYEILVVTRKRTPIPPHKSFDVITFHLPKSGLLSVPFFAIKLCPIIKKFNPEHIFSTLWMPGAAATFTALKLLKKPIPYSIIIHGMEIIESKETLKKRIRGSLSFLKKQIFSHAHKCICISQYTKNKLISQKLCKEEQIVVINNGVNPSTFRSDIAKQPKQYISLLTVARLVPHKGIDQVLYALPKIISEFPDLKYSIVGAGPDRQRLERIVSELILTKNVKFLGQVPDSDLKALYSQADLFVLLSREENHQVEGFGLVFLEAAACKTPSLGGRSGGIPDAILHEQTGWLVSPIDQQEIASTLINILKQPQLIKDMGEAAYTYTLAHRTWEKVTQQILSSSGVSS